MHYDWILDVLSDLKSFADSNGLPVLSEQLADAQLVAATELANMEGRTPQAVSRNGSGAGSDHYLRSAGRSA
jgi:hypothetical protein